MVYGIEKYKEYFEEYNNQYVFIGGSACSILINDLGGSFRVTKDLDVVLLTEYLDKSFGEVFWQFIKDGKYENKRKSSGKDQFYRFSNPKVNGFPKMVELFSRISEKINLKIESHLTPIPFEDEISSLSAILLDDNYYKMLLNGKRNVDGYSVLDLEYLILFKIKAWIDLSGRKQNGEIIDSKTIKKHKNDVFRLLIYSDRTKRIRLSESIMNDLNVFIEDIKINEINLKNLGIKNIKYSQILELLNSMFIL